MVNPANFRPEAARDAGNASELRAYRQVRMVEMRAATTRADDDERTRRALQRLGQFLETGQQPRQDVPQGYYLDITV